MVLKSKAMATVGKRPFAVMSGLRMNLNCAFTWSTSVKGFPAKDAVADQLPFDTCQDGVVAHLQHLNGAKFDLLVDLLVLELVGLVSSWLSWRFDRHRLPRMRRNRSGLSGPLGRPIEQASIARRVCAAWTSFALPKSIDDGR